MLQRYHHLLPPTLVACIQVDEVVGIMRDNMEKGTLYTLTLISNSMKFILNIIPIAYLLYKVEESTFIIVSVRAPAFLATRCRVST